MSATLSAPMNCDSDAFAKGASNACQLFIPLETQCHSVRSQCPSYILNTVSMHIEKDIVPNMCTWPLLEQVPGNLLTSIQCFTVMLMFICNTAFANTQWIRQKLKVRLNSHTGITV